MAGIDQPHRKAPPLQDLKRGNPVDAGRFHGHRFDATLLEPVGQLFEVLGERAKGGHGLGIPIGGHGTPVLAVTDVDARRVGFEQGEGVEGDFRLFLFVLFEFCVHATVGLRCSRPKSGK